MKRALAGLLALGFVCSFAPTLLSADKKGECPLAAKKAGAACEKACDQKVAAASCEGKSACGATAKAGCPVEKAVQEVATIMFRVGDYQTSDGQAAGALAARNHQTVQFIIGGKTYDKIADAAAAINKQVDAKVNQLMAVSFAVGKECVSCPNAAASIAKETNTPVKYRVANVDFTDRKDADAAALRAKQAVTSMLMAYKVGDESYCCAKMAGEAASGNGKPIKFMVQGETTSCPLDAAKKMAAAKIQALFQAVAAAKAS